MPLSLKRQARYSPRGPRSLVQLTTSLVLTDDQVVSARIENLSANGFMAKCAGELDPNTWLGVELPGCGIVRARVRWNEDGEVGCQFRKAIDLDRLTGALGSASPELFVGGANRARPSRAHAAG